MLSSDFGHLLVHRYGIAVRGSNFPSGQEDVNAVVMMAKAAGMMKAADRRDGVTMFLQRFERLGEFVIFAGLGDLVVERMDAVGQINEGAAFGSGDFLSGSQRGHAFQHGEGDAGAHCPEGMSAVD